MEKFLKKFFGGDAVMGFLIIAMLFLLPLMVGVEGFLGWLIAVPVTLIHLYLSISE